MEERLYDFDLLLPVRPRRKTSLKEDHHIDRERLHGKRRKDREDRVIGAHASSRNKVKKDRGRHFTSITRFCTGHGESLMQEIDAACGVQDPVIKYQVVRLDEAVKLQKKLSHKRELRAARRPRRAAPPAAAAPVVPPTPAPEEHG